MQSLLHTFWRTYWATSPNTLELVWIPHFQPIYKKGSRNSSETIPNGAGYMTFGPSHHPRYGLGSALVSLPGKWPEPPATHKTTGNKSRRWHMEVSSVSGTCFQSTTGRTFLQDRVDGHQRRFRTICFIGREWNRRKKLQLPRSLLAEIPVQLLNLYRYQSSEFQTLEVTLRWTCKLCLSNFFNIQ